MNLGTAYYPDYRKRESRPDDFRKMKEAGIRRIRIAEFAWTLMEPQKGQYNWGWLDDSIAMAADFGIEVVLCTPTACPPIWLVEEFPDVLPVDAEGRRTVFGARQHRCYNSPAYREHSFRITKAMAQRYGNHPNVAAWQMDNEFGGEQKKCYCENCRKAFQGYLQEKYQSIEALNERWGNWFWSKLYQRWEQIPVPLKTAADLQMKHDPSLELEFSRFSSDTIVSYSREQAAILRKHAGGRPITTNAFLFRWGDNLNWYELFCQLDAAGIDIYSDKPYEIGFYADVNRSLKSRPFWVMEYGTGSRNLRQEMELLQGRGCEWMFLFKFNPFPWGQEQGTRDVLTITGKPTHCYETARAWTQRSGACVEQSIRSSGIGLFYCFDSSWAYSVEDYLKYPKYVIDVVYQSVFDVDRSIQIVFNKEGLKDIDTMILPLQLIYDRELEDALISFVEAGGKLIVTSDLFQKNEDNVYLEGIPRIYQELLGWSENNFVYLEGKDRGVVVSHGAKGFGKAWVVRKDASLDEWKHIVYSIR